MPDNKKEREISEFGIQQLDQWNLIVSEKLPHLSKPQATVLALWSFGMAVVKTCGSTTVKLFLACLLNVKENTIRQRLREWCYDREDKSGDKRVDLNVESCFPFLLSWIISWWQGNQIGIALDATALSDVFTVLSINVVYRACAIPVAWTITKGNTPGSWNKEWFRMLQSLKGSIPAEYTVIAMTDRGLYSPELYKRLRKIGWHPFMRINAIGTFRPDGENTYRPISNFAKKPGERWQGTGSAFKTRRIKSTLLAIWEEGMDEAWFILTDLSPEASNICWYGMRAWIEQSFRTTKRGGLEWHKTRMKDPKRVQRLWLAISVATIWLMNIGGQADESIPESTIPDITDYPGRRHRPRKLTKLRLVSVFRRGWIVFLVSLIRGEPLPVGAFIPEPWPIPYCDNLKPCEIRV